MSARVGFRQDWNCVTPFHNSSAVGYRSANRTPPMYYLMPRAEFGYAVAEFVPYPRRAGFPTNSATP